MSTLSFKYVLPDSHTFIKIKDGEPKVKVVTGEIIEVDAKMYDRARMYLAGFREVKEDGELSTQKTNEAVLEENEATAKSEQKAAAKAAKNAPKVETEKEVPTVEVPTITPPVVETEVKEDGKEEVTVKVTK